MTRRFLRAAMASVLALGMAPSAALAEGALDGNDAEPVPAYGASQAEEAVKYVDEFDKENNCPAATEIEDDSVGWTDGWYVVNGNVTVANRIQVSGNVWLILADGATLNAEKGIHVPDGSSLTVYGQLDGTGELYANWEQKLNAGDAGIGGDSQKGGGDITVNGGHVYAQGGEKAGSGGYGSAGAGIGGGSSYNTDGNTSGAVTVNGGIVFAKGLSNESGGAAGIGGGNSSGNAGPISIAGGIVVAEGGKNGAAGIGGGGHGGKAAGISITGGWIQATGHGRNGDDREGNANAIGGGANEGPYDSSEFEDAVVIDGTAKAGTVYGSAVLEGDAGVPEGVALTVPKGASLTVSKGTALDVPSSAKVVVEEGAELANEGTVNFGATPIAGWDEINECAYIRAVPNVQGVFADSAFARAGMKISLADGSVYEWKEPGNNKFYWHLANSEFALFTKIYDKPESAEVTADGIIEVPSSTGAWNLKKDYCIPGTFKDWQAKPEAGEGFSVVSENGTYFVEAEEGYEIATSSTAYEGLDSGAAQFEPGAVFWVRKAETDGANASLWTEISMPSQDDIAIVDGAAAQIEETAKEYASSVAQVLAPDQTALEGLLEAYVEGCLKPADGLNIAWEVTVFTPATAGTAQDPDGTDGSFDVAFTVSKNGYSKTIKFEDVAIKATAYQKPKPPVAPSRPTYAPEIVQPAEGGTVTATPARPHEGDEVTVKPLPEDGWEVADVVVKDKDGDRIEVAENPDGTWTFKQPEGRVSIEAVFEKAWENPFSDVDASVWYYGAVKEANRLGLMHGIDGTSLFAPDEGLAREQAATVMWNALGEGDLEASAAPQADVDQSQWYAPYVNWAMASGAMDGYSPDGFGVGDVLTREQFAATVAKAVGADVGTADASVLEGFADEEGVDGWAVQAMAWAVENGVVNGVEQDDGSRELQAARAITRAEMATMVVNAVEVGMLEL